MASEFKNIQILFTVNNFRSWNRTISFKNVFNFKKCVFLFIFLSFPLHCLVASDDMAIRTSIIQKRSDINYKSRNADAP